MNANAELLNFVYQNSQMGVDTLTQLLDVAENADFREYLRKQRDEYDHFHERAAQMLSENGCDEKGLNVLEKMRTYLMINIQTVSDHSPSHIAGLLVSGSSMGIVDAIKKIRRYGDDVEKDVRKLMEDLRDFEERNVEKLKEYL